MGILNVTPDSFSDGGRFLTPGDALARGRAMAAAGADIVDVGGESTRPGAAPVPAEEEIRRIRPVIEGLRGLTGRDGAPLLVSVDTRKAAVAASACEAGAHIVNDISALTHDPAMAAVARRYATGVVLMHMQGTPGTMQTDPQYTDVVAEVVAYLDARRQAAAAAGLDPASVALDPGLGFGKTPDHNLRLLARVDALAALGRPVLIGVSRKSTLGRLTGRPPGELLAASLAALTAAVLRGAHIVRVHDVPESVDAATVIAALRKEGLPCPG
jgi:dihydropteroate synthase